MKTICGLIFVALLAACSTTPQNSEEFLANRPSDSSPSVDPSTTEEQYMLSKLGMIRPAEELGFEEQKFNPCKHGLLSRSNCTNHYITVLHFQLLCRDSVGTVANVPIDLTPLSSDNVKWNLGSNSGGTKTDSHGYGQVTLISTQSTKDQRLTLRIGKQFLGFTISEVSKVVLPKNFCSGRLAANFQ